MPILHRHRHYHRSRRQIFHHQIHLHFHLRNCRPEEASLKIPQYNPQVLSQTLDTPSTIYYIEHTRRPVGFIESIQHALAESSYPLQLREVDFIECCYHDIEINLSLLDAAPRLLQL